MKNQQLAYIYGGVASITSFIIFVLLYIFGSNPFGNLSWLGAFIPILFIVMGSIKVRDELFGGIISYSKVFITGMIITVAWSLGFAILAFLFCQFIEPNIITWHIQDTLVNMEQASQFLSEEMMEAAMEEIEKMTLFDVIQGDFINKIIGGLIISLISSAFIKKNEPMFNNDSLDQ